MSRNIVLKNEFGTLEYEEEYGEYFIHLTLHKWSHKLYREYIKTFNDWCISTGRKQVFCLIDANDVKLQKFETMFGFTTLHVENGQRLMVKDIGE